MAFRAAGLLGPPLNVEEFLGDKAALHWYVSRFLPGSPPVFGTFLEVTVRAVRTSAYLDYAVEVALSQKR